MHPEPNIVKYVKKALLNKCRVVRDFPWGNIYQEYYKTEQHNTDYNDKMLNTTQYSYQQYDIRTTQY